MKISDIKLEKEKDGLLPFHFPMLGDVVLLTGGNGAGKTRLLKMIQTHVTMLRNGEDTDSFALQIDRDGTSEVLTEYNVDDISIINYSHYDAKLQFPNDFSPYVIHSAKDKLLKCDYEETALNALLFIEDMARGYSEEFEGGEHFQKFKRDVEDCFDLKIDYNSEEGKLYLFGIEAEKALLSPGQQYLLRMAVACFQNRNEPNLVFFMDEPELHLHTKALIEMIKKLRSKFPMSQFWISTHSLPLVSYYTVMEKSVTTLVLHDRKVELFRSNSDALLEGLVGSEENQYAVQELFALTDEYACNKFTFECYDEADVTEGKSRTDVEVALVKTELHPNDIVVDYGAGKGRFFEELCWNGMDTDNDIAKQIQYYAYDRYDTYSLQCKNVMNKYGSTDKNYFNDIEELKKEVREKAQYVLLVNVLHEIPLEEWTEVFQNIRELLCEHGKLLIVERDELMVGEKNYSEGFLMLTSNGAKCLFGANGCIEKRHPQKNYIVKYIIDKKEVEVDSEKVCACINAIYGDALEKIRESKAERPADRKLQFKAAMKMVFWLHQYANASLLKEKWHSKRD